MTKKCISFLQKFSGKSVFAILFALSFCFVATPAYSQSRDFKTIGLNLMGRYYSMKNASSDVLELSPMYEAEIDLRLYKVYHFALVGMQSTDKNRSGYGGGLRINLPGYFLLGAKLPDLTRDSKMYPVNTSIYGFAIKTTLTKDDQTVEDSVIAQYGGTVDVFLFSQYVYLTLDVGIHTLKGDSEIIYGAGLGFQF